jgi:glutamate--cysteine ligase
MTRRFDTRLDGLSSPALRSALVGGLRGVEKESLRVTLDGRIAITPHPPALGAALTNRFVTTDYSEALLEFVTPPMDSPWAVLQFLCDIHQFVYAQLGDEILWALSMPCFVRAGDEIPLARYGTSNVGRMKTVYRRGLGYRYGRLMQAISGVHFNYSLADEFWPAYRDIERGPSGIQEFRSSCYLAMVRNVRRLDWLLLYLFGASPAVCKSFVAGIETDLQELDAGTFYGPHATSLRMSDIGYQNKNQAQLQVSANSLEEYVSDLTRAILTPHPEYAQIGVKVGSAYRQLSANQLQIENEYYSTIRPKRVARSGERPTTALLRGGVEYVELRALDVSPFDPVGINRNQVRFLEAFLVYCLLLDSPASGADEQLDNAWNHGTVARRGREPGLGLRRNQAMLPLRAWAAEIFDDLRAVAELLDAGDQSDGYLQSVSAFTGLLEDPGLTPAGLLISELTDRQQSLYEYGLSLSMGYRDYFNALALELNRHAVMLEQESRESFQRQDAIESGDVLSFEEYLEQYFA